MSNREWVFVALPLKSRTPVTDVFAALHESGFGTNPLYRSVPPTSDD